MDQDLERARAEIDAATDDADRQIQTQLHSIDEGLFEEEAADDGPEGDRDARPGPKPDRLAELLEKLDGLRAEATGETATRIEAAQDAIRDYMHDHPRGPGPGDSDPQPR